MDVEDREHELFDCLATFDGWGAARQVREALGQGVSVATVVTDLLSPVQRRVGLQWQRGSWSVAQEHAITAIIDDLLGILGAQVPRFREGAVALVSAEGEWHVTPARMAALVWRTAGWDVTFLGGSTPPEHLERTLGLLRVDHVAVSCTVPLALPGAVRVVEVLRGLEVPLLAGGRAFGRDALRADTLGFDGWLASATDAPELFRHWMERPPTSRLPLGTDDEELSLELRLPEFVAVGERRLAQRFPPMRAYTVEQRARTREDLESILRFATASLTVQDDRIMHEFLVWLAQVLVARGVPVDALLIALDVLAGAALELPRTVTLLEAGRQRLEDVADSWAAAGVLEAGALADVGELTDAGELPQGDDVTDDMDLGESGDAGAAS